MASFIVAFLITLFVTGIFAFTGFAYPTHKLLPESYYYINNPERLKSIYKHLGVKHFRNFLLLAFWGREKNRKKYFDGTKQGFENFIFQTKQSEFGHLAAFIVILILTFVLLVNGYYFIPFVATIINIIGNIYPIILQRAHRVRIEKIFNRKNLT
jgi:hypothetical protein